MPFRHLGALWMLSLAAACTAPGAPEITYQVPEAGASRSGDELTDACGDVRPRPLVYRGTDRPRQMPLSEAQLGALGLIETSLGVCSAALIGPRLALTAAHCFAGPDLVAPPPLELANDKGELRRLPVRAVDRHPAYSPCEAHDTSCLRTPEADLAVVTLEASALSGGAPVEPLPVATTALKEEWLGLNLEVAGFGLTEDGSLGKRSFAVMELTALTADRLVVDAGGERGVCPGDSGGPALTLATDGSVRIAGIGNRAVSHDECRSGVGFAVYTRLEPYLDWLEAHQARQASSEMRTPSATAGGAGAGCGPITNAGECSPMGAVYCHDERVQVDECGSGDACGWDPDAEGFRCIPEGRDPCGGIGGAGQCDGQIARWCDGGTLRTRDCGMCGLRCGHDASLGAVGCVEAD